jgi:hypothetical protein
MKLKLLVLLKSVKNWVFENNLADVEERFYFGDKNESN